MEKKSAKQKPSPTVPKAAAPARKPAAARKSADSTDWDQRLGFLMHDVSRLRRAVFDEFMKPLGVTRSQWWVLIYLARHDGMNQSDLANLLELGKAALGGLVDRLELSGLIERRADSVDRRAKRIYLCPKGVQLIREMRVKSDEMSELILDGLTYEQRDQLTELMARVKKNLLTVQRSQGSRDDE